MSIENINIDCNFCKYNIVAHSSSIIVLIDNLINDYSCKKKCNQSIYRLNLIKRIFDKSNEINDIILSKNAELYKKLDNFDNFNNVDNINDDIRSIATKNFLISYSSYNIGLNQCHFCYTYACDYHTIYVNYYFCKCDLCNNNVSICGWCKEIYSIDRCKQCIKYIKKSDSIEINDIHSLNIYTHN